MRIQLFCASLLIGLMCAPLAAADKPAPPSLDDQLLDDLDTELLPAKGKPVAEKTEKPTPPRAKPGADAGLDEKLLDEIDGEDVELGPKTDPLTRIGKNMRKVESLIDGRDISARTQDMQRQIVRDLDLLLEQTKKQCQGGQCKSPSSPQQGSKTAAGKKPAEGDPGNKPARDSTERLGKAGKTDVKSQEELDEMVKRVWGHLPEKVRGQMQNVSMENFLPKYEKLIEEYYKRLAEEPR
jgi:hypothetical protein